MKSFLVVCSQGLGVAFVAMSLFFCNEAYAGWASCTDTNNGCAGVGHDPDDENAVVLPCANGNGNCTKGTGEGDCACNDNPAIAGGCTCQLST